MDSLRPLSALFVSASAGQRGEAGDPDGAELEQLLEQAVARGSAAWPSLPLTAARFVAYLGERVPSAELASARVEDLWIACACASERRDDAIALVEARFLVELGAPLAKMGLGAARVDEVKQVLRHVLFVGSPDDGVPPRIGDYRGAGDLRGWLRVSATRAALKLLRGEHRESTTDVLLDAASPVDDPELAYMKSAYRASFKEAFQEALDSLSPRERLLLKQQVVDGLNVDDLGALYQVHRATAARWVASARELLLERTRRAFVAKHRLSKEEGESLMRLVRSQLDLSLHRRLADVGT